jgi:hypothetical protein
MKMNYDRSPRNRKCAELIHLLVERARQDRSILRQLQTRFDTEMPTDQLVRATRQAIVDATRYDAQKANTNFSYDEEAYNRVLYGFRSLLGRDELTVAMELDVVGG